jgi:hypothetical protein
MRDRELVARLRAAADTVPTILTALLLDRAAARIEALEALIAEELNPNNCVDAANADLAEEIHKRMDAIR